MTQAVALAQMGSNNTTFRNRIINGAMMIDQRNNGGSVSITSAGGVFFTVDRFFVYNGNTATLTAQRSTTAPAGFSNSLLVTVTGTSAGASQTAIYQRIEGLNCADLNFGSANAQPVTLSFWVRSSVTGTYNCALRNSAQNRSYVTTYAINSANTWEQKTVTIPGDQSGTWATDNSTGIEVTFSLGTAGSQTINTWSTGAIASSGTINLTATNGATFYITGVQLEEGTTASPFELRPYGTELVLCQRYYWRIFSNGSNAPFTSGNAENTTRGYVNLTLPQPMRTNPNCSISNIAHLALRGVGTDVACSSGTFGPVVGSAMMTIIGGEFNTASATGASAGGCVKMSWNNSSAWIDASAEL